MDGFTRSPPTKVLNAYAVREGAAVLSVAVQTLSDLKRIRLGLDTQVLLVPRYQEKAVKQGGRGAATEKQRVLVDYLAFVYRNEERVLTDVIYSYRDASQYPPKI